MNLRRLRSDKGLSKEALASCAGRGQRSSLDVAEPRTDATHSSARAQPRAHQALRPGLY